jgi:hypothetical protein
MDTAKVFAVFISLAMLKVGLFVECGVYRKRFASAGYLEVNSKAISAQVANESAGAVESKVQHKGP